MGFYRTCSRCGKIHDSNYKCNVGREYRGGQERELRNKYSWHKKSLQIREDAQNLCEVCKAQGIYTYKGLEVHHITKVKEDSTGLLDDSNLICLCAEHHHQADAGILSEDYLRQLVRIRIESP